jgi:hypothetical protein
MGAEHQFVSGENAAFNRTKAKTLKYQLQSNSSATMPKHLVPCMTARQLQLPSHSQLIEKGRERKGDT